MEASAITAPAETAATRTGALQLGVLVLGIGILYCGTLAGLAGDWAHDQNYSHGVFVPLFCAWVLWRERRKWLAVPARPANAGLAVIAASLGMLLLGLFGAELFLARSSLVFLLAGLAIYVRGWRFLRAVLFPWVVLFLMIPIPAIIFNQIAFPLQFQASRLATGLLALAGVPVLRQGNIIQLPSLALDVVEACSGIRSLVTLITLTVFYGYAFEPSRWKRVLLALAAIPIAVLANGVRIMGSGLLGQYWSPEKAEGFFHTFSGWLIFVISLLLLIALHKAMSWRGVARPSRKNEGER